MLPPIAPLDCGGLQLRPSRPLLSLMPDSVGPVMTLALVLEVLALPPRGRIAPTTRQHFGDVIAQLALGCAAAEGGDIDEVGVMGPVAVSS